MTAGLVDVLRDVTERLDAQAAAFALIGGLAVSAHTEPRFTRDVDLAVAVERDEAAEALVRSLAPAYEVDAILEHETLDRMAAVRLHRTGTTSEGVVVDLLFASSGAEREITASADPLDVFPGVRVPVARIGHLIVLKLLSREERRPLDTADLHALLAVASPDDLEAARGLAALVVQRGTNRERDLAGDLEQLLRQR